MTVTTVANDNWRNYEQRWSYKDGWQVLTYCSVSCVCGSCLGNDYALRTGSRFKIELEED